MKRLLFLVILLNLLVSYGQSTKIRTVTVAPQMQLQNYEHFKRLVLDSPDSQVEYLEGFNFEWGFRYRVKVKEVELKPTLSDGTKYKYELIEIVEREAVLDTTIKLVIDPMIYYYEISEDEKRNNMSLVEVNDSTYRYFDQVEILVSDDLKESFKNLSMGDKIGVGEFRFEDGKLRLVKI